MKSTEKHDEKKNSISKKIIYFLGSILLLTTLFGGYIFSDKYFASEPRTGKEEFGEKVVITLPNGKKVFTYENLIVKEDGKLLYKGERNTIDLSGGVVVYEDWKD
ncbi:hypothetical protein ACTQ5K_04050 [Niallia sp. Sow4_A1]|uniref:Uncharacterized protein n=1 Tax=Niallia hominis TaxID=3133173 RepID=A0ABV1ETF4_9BACI|nr:MULTISPECIES: hypothetical protein [Bacillaceae]MCM3360589.1 hypothetical protein [Niallia sp. MER TA 168]CAI9389852.1 hypothetical protein BACSP_02634 [Bacillus sp. T2.9-1]